jgi:hypothetical protein
MKKPRVPDPDVLYSEERRLSLELARRKLSDFILEASEGIWEPTPLHLYLCSIFEEAVDYIDEGHEEPLLIRIHMPSRHGKSDIFSRYGPAWFLLTHPDLEVIQTGYNADIALEMSRDARGIYRRMAPLFNASPLSQESQSVSRWAVAGRRGKMQAAGVQGTIVGRGGNLIVIDDPHKDRAEAESLVIQRKIERGYESNIRTRLAPGGVIILVMHRWHTKDLAGRLERKEKRGDGEVWKTYAFEALCEHPEEDPLGRKKGEALWPTRWTRKSLLAMKKGMGPHVWAAMGQQRPKEKLEGTLWTERMIGDHRVLVAPDLSEIIVGVDPSGGETGDEVGIVTAGRGREDGEGYPIADDSDQYSPEGWGIAVLKAYVLNRADRILGERNFGGDLVLRNIQATTLVYWEEVDEDGHPYPDSQIVFERPGPELLWDPDLGDPDAGLYRERTLKGSSAMSKHDLVTHSRGKALRAEPIANLYAQGLVHHVGTLDALEDEMTTWVGRGPNKSSESPNRIDALVIALSELLGDEGGGDAEFLEL